MTGSPCNICCHETRNSLAAVVYFAKKVQQSNPSQDSRLLEQAIQRLDRQQKVCAVRESAELTQE